jgi:hypothetical protein
MGPDPAEAAAGVPGAEVIMNARRSGPFEPATGTWIGRLFLLLAAAWLFGCETPPTMTDTEAVESAGGIAFGSVEVYMDGDLQKWGVKFTGSKYFYLTILPPDSNEAITYKVARDGKFYWTLPPGEYLLLGYHWQDMQTQRSGRIGATFSVPAGGADVYLGAMVFRCTELFLVPAYEDRFEAAKTSFAAKFPDRQREMVRQLIEPARSPGEFSAFRGQCHEDWGIECTDRFKGVTPSAPEVSQSGFPDAGSLQPEFRWKPSSKPGVSYDLIIYDAAAYTVGGAMIPMYMKGREVAYVQDLKAASWRPPEPLAPDTRYFWSVRLREGETVSGWSTQGHFTFLIVAMSAGHGQWFQFMTP